MDTPTPQTDTNVDRDANPYIRTYEMDLAKVAPAAQLSQGKPKQKKTHGLFGLKPKKDRELQFANTTARQIETERQTEAAQQIEMRSARSSAVEQELSSQMAEVTEPPAQPPQQTESLPPAQPKAPPTPSDSAREDVLARLRARAAASSAATPIPQTPPAAPTATQVTEPEPMPQPVVEPVTPPVTEPPVPPAPKPSPFHSYSTDFADRIDARHASAFSVLAAEEDAAVASMRPSKSKVIPIVVGTIFIIGSIAGLYGAYQYMRSQAPIALIPSVQSLISADKKLALSSNNPSDALEQAANQPLPAGSVMVTYMNGASTTPKGSIVQVPQSGAALLAALNLNAPDILIRNVDPVSTIGIAHAGDETRPFFLLKVSSYQRTFAGMLTWEPTMADDLGKFYPAHSVQQVATDTPAVPVSSGRFDDEVVASHSVRVLRDGDGESRILYGYTADKQVLVIARDEAAFELLIQRLSASGY